MTAQALAGALAGITLVLLAVVAALLADRRRNGERGEREVGRVREQALRDLERHAKEARAELERARGRLDGLDRSLASARTQAELELRRRESAERAVEALELELARRRLGPVLEGDTVALTTPDDRTLRGIVRQTFDGGAVLLGAATLYVERTGRGGEVEVEEIAAGDVAVPAYRWAQKLPPDAQEG